MRFGVSRFCLLLLAALAGCDTYAPPGPDLQPSLVQNYLLDSGDQLRITVFGQADLTNTYEVDKGGHLTFPLIGTVSARGTTTAAVAAEVRTKLARSYIRNPDVSVEVARYRPFFIMGEVASGGQYQYVAGLTVQQAVAIAGGFSPRANRSLVDLTRQSAGREVTIAARLTDPVFPGDTVNIRERLF
ncbi:MAG: polysaccharide biosynthesis/export family protein [Bauldia sp.]